MYELKRRQNVTAVISASAIYKGVSTPAPVSYTHLRAHETSLHLVCRLLLEKKMEMMGIDPTTCRMLSDRSTI